MAKTRSKKEASSAGGSVPSSASLKYALPAESENPPKLFILPKQATSAARVVSLSNPRHSKATRYLVCPETGVYEFTKISTPKTTPRSWLIEGSVAVSESGEVFPSQTTKSADLYVTTRLDPLFLVLPALAVQNAKSSKRMFLASDDHFDALSKPDETTHLSELLRWPATRSLLEARMAAVCDTVDAGDQQMYRLNEKKLVKEILSKAQKMAENGLPKSLDEKFVRKALEAPVLSIKTNPLVTKPLDNSDSQSGTESVATPGTELSESQASISSVETAATSVSDASTAATSIAGEDEILPGSVGVVAAMAASAEITKLQRVLVAFNFICASYIAPSFATALKKALEDQKDVDFAPLNEYTTKLAKLRQEAMASRSMSDFSRKRTLDEDNDERAEKKRKKDEEEKRKKANESRGVRDLKKVNTSGMKKLSEFFKKK